jgi:hypothetical protein
MYIPIVGSCKREQLFILEHISLVFLESGGGNVEKRFIYKIGDILVAVSDRVATAIVLIHFQLVLSQQLLHSNNIRQLETSLLDDAHLVSGQEL